jgi:catechol-2,3-dioxygenase
VYRDRPRSEWPYSGWHLSMGVERLDLEDLVAELNGRDESSARHLTLGDVYASK